MTDRKELENLKKKIEALGHTVRFAIDEDGYIGTVFIDNKGPSSPISAAEKMREMVSEKNESSLKAPKSLTDALNEALHSTTKVDLSAPLPEPKKTLLERALEVLGAESVEGMVLKTLQTNYNKNSIIKDELYESASGYINAVDLYSTKIRSMIRFIAESKTSPTGLLEHIQKIHDIDALITAKYLKAELILKETKDSSKAKTALVGINETIARFLPGFTTWLDTQKKTFHDASKVGIMENVDVESEDPWIKEAVGLLDDKEGYDGELKVVDSDSDSDSFRAEHRNDEWVVFENYDAAEKAAKEDVKNSIDDVGIMDAFTPGFVDSHIDIEKLGRDLAIDTEDMVRESPDSYGKPKGEEFTDEEIDALVEEQENIVKRDPVGYLEDIYGDTGEFFKEHPYYIDIDSAIQEAVDVDGVAHFLASYDGDEVELNGTDGKTYYAYRRN